MSFPSQTLTTQEVLTFQDAVDRLALATGCRATGREYNQLRMAVLDAYKDLPNKHSWSYYKRAFQITTVAPETGKVCAYDHTGGTYERQLTLTTGTWNDQAADGQVVLGDNLYNIFEMI